MNVFFIAAGALLAADTLFIITRSNINAGVIMPAVLGVPLLIYGIFFDRLSALFSYGAGRYVFIFIAVCYALFLLLVAVCSLLMLNAYRHGGKTAPDVIIVLGAAVHGKTPSRALKNRLDLAFDIYSRGGRKARIVVSGGMGPQEQVTEASAMKDYLVSKGVLEHKILTEDKAQSTYDNFRFSRELFSENIEGLSFLFVTSDFHVYRAKLAARAAGFPMEGTGCRSPFYILPNYCIRESMAIFRYFLFGLR